jgi:hypothetical protein
MKVYSISVSFFSCTIFIFLLYLFLYLFFTSSDPLFLPSLSIYIFSISQLQMNKQPDVSIPRPVSSKKSSLKHSGGNKNGGKDSKGDKEKGEKEKDKDKGEGSMQRAEREREREREREKGEQLFPTLLEVAVELACSQVGGVYVDVCVYV